MEKLTFQSGDETVEFYVEEQTTISGVTYLLVSDSREEEANAYILKEISEKEGQEVCYEMVEDEKELLAVSGVFAQMLEDVDIEC